MTTHNRPLSLSILLNQINEYSKCYETVIAIYDDASAYATLDICRDTNTKVNYYVGYGVNRGKKEYWKTIHEIFQRASDHEFDYFFLLQDDCELIEDFFTKAIEEYEAIKDPNKASLCTFTPTTVYDRYMWSKNKATDVSYGGRKFIKCNYVDCIFMCPRSTLELLDFTIHTIDPSRFVMRNVSSGVGQQITERLLRSRKTLFCAYSSLITDHSNDSKMNYSERKKNPLFPLIRENKYEPRDPVYVGIASIPERVEQLEQVINSLIDQVDFIFVYLNNYSYIPSFLNHEKIQAILGTAYAGDIGDAGKFWFADTLHNVYYFSCDDDIIYPPDYVDVTVSAIEKTHRKAIVSYHGAILNPTPIENYYKDRIQCHFMIAQEKDVYVHVGGTGVMAYHTDLLKLDVIVDFPEKNMADIWVGLKAQELKIPIICLKHEYKWLKMCMGIEKEKTIYGSKKNHDIQTKVVNENVWIINLLNNPFNL